MEKVSEQNYSLELLKQGAENARDKFLEDPYNIDGFDPVVDNWLRCEDLELHVEFKDREVFLRTDAHVQVNRDGEYISGEFEVYKAEVMDSDGEITWLSSDDMDAVSQFLKW